jgi:hypothetical protein
MNGLTCFACHAPATTVFRAAPVEIVALGDPDRSSRTATGPWITCRLCAVRIIRGEWHVLADVAVAAALDAQPALKAVPHLRSEILQLHADFAAARTGGPEPLAGFVL